MTASTFRNKVSITHIGTATAILDIDGITFITDPFFSPAGTESPDGYPLKVHHDPGLKLEELPHIDAVLLSHENHWDNLDDFGRRLLDGRTTVTTNDGANNLAPRPSVLGFSDWQERDVRIAGTTFHITATPCRHFPGHECVGFVLHTESFGVAPDGRPNAIYFSGDTVYVEELAKIADKYHITVAIMNCGKATIPEMTPEGPGGPDDSLQITLDGRQAARLLRDLKADVLVPMHYDLWDHFTQHGDGLAKEFKEEGVLEQVHANHPALAVVAFFLAIMNTWGMIISFGVFQTYYVSNLHQTRSDIAWVGSIAVFLLFFTGIVSGRLTDAGYYRIITATGAVLVVLGTFMTSLAETYWQVLLAQGVCTGLGNGCLLTPMSTLVSSYFKRRLPLVTGIAACGSVTGGLIYPSMVRTLLPTIGFGWTLRAIGFIQLGTFVVALVCGKPRIGPKKSGPLLDLAVFKEIPFILLLVGSFLAFLGVFFPFFFLSSYAREKRGMSYTNSLNLTLVLNGIGFAGRLLPSLIARFCGTMNVYIFFIFCSALCMYTWIPVHSTPGLYAWTTFYSLSVGGVQSLSLAIVPVIISDTSKMGASFGIVFAAIGIGALLGSPVCGSIITSSGGSYAGAQAFSGSVLVAGGLIILAAREAKRRQKQEDVFVKM
ncbi:MFS general substrate transporter [Ophiobolus disseminans]|uniref:MFS general substrate transporter n=1 Tax=Ophiobolus disseminans TaxID=1469910 RepID=A0A6A7A8R2_9PLEO|nr:MFS general substrate transporter [Ophiobolus disseminans]